MKKTTPFIFRKNILVAFLLTAASYQASAFTCKDINGNIFNNSSWGASYNSDIYIDLKPQIGANENLLIRLGDFIQCRNDSPKQWNDYLDYSSGSSFGGGLNSFTGVITSFNGSRYSFPTTQRVRSDEYRGTKGFYKLTGVLYLTPISGASGVVINGGQVIATVKMIKWAQHRKTTVVSNDVLFAWRFIANNSVTVPVGGCDVNTRSVNVSLGSYPIDTSEKDININVRCGKNRDLKFFLSGKTDSQSIFSNTSSSSPASGIGIELVRNGRPVMVNTPVSLGSVGTSYKSLDLKARYALNGKTLTTGNVQSVIGVNFTYN